jgi:tetratricopeptide (TPR) repeat protein
MGVVYLALARGPGGFAKLKVIKRLHPDLADEPAAVRMFLEEGRLAARLHHPNVVQTSEAGFDGKHYFLEMEYLEGRSYNVLVRSAARRGGVSLETHIYVLTQALAGLHYAHEVVDHDGTPLHIVHRDVSPHNVFVTYDGEVKLLDFGIAKAAGSSSETRTGFLKGKLTYMAPEQAAKGPLDRRADLFAVGVILWEVLTGQRLWGDLDDFEILHKLRLETAPSPRALRADVPAPLDAVCSRALARDPADRFSTAAEMQEALEAWLATTGPRVGPAELARCMVELFGEDREASRAEIAEAVRALPVTGSAPALPASAAASHPAPGGTGTTRAEHPTREVRTLRAMALLVIAMMLVVVAMAVRVRWRARAPAPIDAPAVATPAAGFPEYGSEMSRNAEATAAYRDGMLALRDADGSKAIAELDRALSLDPDFAAAHLRRALIEPELREAERAHVREAIRMRVHLGEHDRLLADAFAPRASVPEEPTETAHRLGRARQAFPDDADFAFQHCRAQNLIGDFVEAKATCARARQLAPDSAATILEGAMVSGRMGDAAGAREGFNECLRASPLATSCLSALTSLDAVEGRCADALTGIRRSISLGRESPGDHALLASLLLGKGESIESARPAFDFVIAHSEPSRAPVARAQSWALLATYGGDFAEASRQFQLWGAAVAASQDEAVHFRYEVPRLQLLEEEGRRADAVAVARDYLRRRETWTLATNDDFSIYFDGELYRLGGLSRDEFMERRDRWLAAKRAQPAGNIYGSSLGFAWIAAYGGPAHTPEDAREALDALPRYLPLPQPLMQFPEFVLPTGTVYFLAGRYAEAIPYLTTAARCCDVLASINEIMTASLELGLARENTGDDPGACDAYGDVVHRWGSASPPSVTAAKAKTRMRALGCRQ